MQARIKKYLDYVKKYLKIIHIKYFNIFLQNVDDIGMGS